MWCRVDIAHLHRDSIPSSYMLPVSLCLCSQVGNPAMVSVIICFGNLNWKENEGKI